MRKHRINIVLGHKDRQESVLRSGTMRLPKRLLRFLFGECTEIFILQPGQTVSAVEIHEERENTHGVV